MYLTVILDDNNTPWLLMQQIWVGMICGAMIFVSLSIKGTSLNIYSEVGLVMRIGLIPHFGVLIVQFANDLQEKG